MTLALTERTALRWLHVAAQNVRADQACVELGVFRGGSLAYIAAGAATGNGAKVYGVDGWNFRSLKQLYTSWPHVFLWRNKRAAAKAAPRATLIRAPTTRAAAEWRGPKVGLLYVDADHRRAGVLNDYWSWRKHLAPNAVVAFDDYLAASPSRRAVNELRGNGVFGAVSDLVRAGELSRPIVIGERLAVSSYLGDPVPGCKCRC